MRTKNGIRLQNTLQSLVGFNFQVVELVFCQNNYCCVIFNGIDWYLPNKLVNR